MNRLLLIDVIKKHIEEECLGLGELIENEHFEEMQRYLAFSYQESKKLGEIGYLPDVKLAECLEVIPQRVLHGVFVALRLVLAQSLS
jgi:hypothetical protein